MNTEEQKFYHLGHVMLDCFQKLSDAVCLIDADTGESETYGSVLCRSIQLARSLTALGLVPGDVLALGGKNHMDLHIPSQVTHKQDNTEILSLFKLTTPKVAFCDPKDYEIYTQSARELGLDTKVFTFGDGPHSMKELVKDYPSDIKGFQLPEFDMDKVYLWLISTSGTTGTIKVAAFTHAAGLKKSYAFAEHIKALEPSPAYKKALNISPVQWLSSVFNQVVMPLLGQTKVQTTAPLTVDHLIDVINKERPATTMIGPTMMSNILKHDKPCDLTSFDTIILTGSKMPENLVVEINSRFRKGAKAIEAHAQTETIGPVLFTKKDSPPNSCGSSSPYYQVQLVDPETEEVITEPNVPGELWVKGFCIFKEYYRNPEETAKAFSKDGWFKTGDLLKRDELDNYYFVSRIKTLIKYQNYHVVPGELEDVIRSHPGVQDVVVTSEPHPLDGEHPLACVVRKPGSDVTAQEIKDLVAEKLSEKKQLRGGVVFVKELPQTSSGKMHIRELKRIIETLAKE